MKFNLPVILLKSLVILPFQEVRIELSNDISKKAVSYASKYHDNKILVVCPIDQMEEEPDVNDLPKIGVIGRIKTKIELPNGNLRVLIKGIERVDVIKYINYKEDKDVLESENQEIELVKYDQTVKTATLRKLFDVLQIYIKANHSVSNSILSSIKGLDELEKVTDVITSFLPFSTNQKLWYIDEVNAIKRAEKLIEDLNIEVEVIALEEKIDNNLKEKFELQEREIIIKEKIKELNKELSYDSLSDLSNTYYKKIDELKLDEASKKKITNEIKRLDYTSENSPESSVIHSYLDWVLNLPWNVQSKDNKDIKHIRKVLDKNHLGLDKVKNTIIEYVVAKSINKNINAPIICLVGPPGVGKTTLAKSVAESLNRKFCKISVGGLNDSSELIGHSRTYLGAIPGKIIQGINKCGVNNPVFLIDEVDKMVKDYKGDPASVLLDILDKEQNNLFVDSYIEEPFDLGNVIFILTANDTKAIPDHLKDRLDIIYLNSYADYEKVDIIKKHILPKILNEHKLTNEIKFNDKALYDLVNNYTNEAGLRDVERKITTTIRKIITENYDNLTKMSVNIKSGDLEKYLGRSNSLLLDFTSHNIGVANALGINAHGGLILKVECRLISGNKDNMLTGNLEDNLKEGINVAIDYILCNKELFKIDSKIIKDKYFHIHFSNNNFKKDGTSGGLSVITAILSLLKNKEIPNDISFTGEVSLTGEVLSVGEVKEKIIASYNNNLKKVYIPFSNIVDLDNISIDIKEKMTIIPVKNYMEVYEDIFK